MRLRWPGRPEPAVAAVESPGLPGREQVFVEQVRLLLGNVGSSVLPAYLLAVLMAVGLYEESMGARLWVWCAAVIASKTVDALHAAYYLRAGHLNPANVESVFVELMLLHTFDAAAWASLALVTLSSASTVEFMLVNSVLAGIAGSSMSLLAPVLPVFITFIAVEFSIVSYKFWQLGEASYQLLILALVLYFASLSLQARNSSRAALAAIRLRFQNTELLERLQQETDKAQASQREAVQANLAKSRFLAAASHDLRQPIHALGLFLSVLSGSGLTKTQREVLDNARSVAGASQEMLDTLLDFSRIEAGVVHVQPEAFALQDLFFKIEKEFAPQANAKGLLYRTRDTDAVLLSDRKLVELVVRNLVSNAIRYTHQGGVLVACRRRADHAVIEVWDTGIGIPDNQHQAIFQEFHQLGNPERDRRKGLGLGLAIAAGLSATLGHRLGLASRLGRGSVFRLEVPLAHTEPDAQQAPAADEPAASLQGLRLLVLDDDHHVREAMRQVLTGFGCECVTVDSLDEALLWVRLQPPDVLITDYRLGGQKTGVQAIHAMRQSLGQPLPAILITGDTAPERLRDAHASGVRLMHKPVLAEDLQLAITQVWAARHPRPQALAQ